MIINRNFLSAMPLHYYVERHFFFFYIGNMWKNRCEIFIFDDVNKKFDRNNQGTFSSVSIINNLLKVAFMETIGKWVNFSFLQWWYAHINDFNVSFFTIFIFWQSFEWKNLFNIGFFTKRANLLLLFNYSTIFYKSFFENWIIISLIQNIYLYYMFILIINKFYNQR